MQHDGEADEDCVTPSNVLNFEELTDKTKTRTGSLRGKGTNTPDVHVHNYFGETAHQPLSGLSHHNVHNAVTPGPNVGVLRMKRKRYGTPKSSDDESDGSDLKPIDIADMLQILHNSMPSFNFPQYHESLLSKGICYGRSVVDFSEQYYVDRVGMMDGAAAEFVRSAKRMLGKQKKEKH
jgi:hypothetical protein